MKLTEIRVTTSYPRGYGRDDPKLISGEITVRLGPDSWNAINYTLSTNALKEIALVAMKDFKANNEKAEIPNVLFFEEADLPPEPEPEPEPAPEPLTFETENGDKVALRPVT